MSCNPRDQDHTGRNKTLCRYAEQRDENGVFRDIVHPIGSDARNAFEELIISAYENHMKINAVIDENRLPVVDEPAASVVRRIYEMRSQGISPRHIANALNAEGVPTASDYYYAKLGKSNPRRKGHLRSSERIRAIVNNPTYLGHLAQLRTTAVSYKNHKIIKKGETMPLSGLMFCADCGEKMRLCTNNTTNGSKKLPRKYIRHNYQCESYRMVGCTPCFCTLFGFIFSRVG